MENRKMEQFYFVLDKISICMVFLLEKLYFYMKFISYKLYYFSKEKSKLLFTKYRNGIMEILITITLISYAVFLAFILIGILYLIEVIDPIISISYALFISYSISASFVALIFYIMYKECQDEVKSEPL